MSLYHETAEILQIPAAEGGNLKTRIFGKKPLKAAPQQVYALALESCKWSAVLKEVIDNAGLLRLERKLTPVLALLLVHDFLLSKGGIALPGSHGLRASVERHKARLSAELTRARLRRKAGTVDALRDQVEAAFAEATNIYPRWVRVNALRSTLEDQLATTFRDFTRVGSVKDVVLGRGKCLLLDEHVPNLVAISPSFEIIKTEAYRTGKVILQDKASCFPAYLLDARPEDGDAIDSCSAPGNKTTHLAAIIHSRTTESQKGQSTVYAFEKDPRRAKTLEKMVKLAGADDMTRIGPGQDFLRVQPEASPYQNVSSLLLDPSCSGSGIVGRDSVPDIHLPEPGTSKLSRNVSDEQTRKRKRAAEDADPTDRPVLIDDDGEKTVLSSEREMASRLEALSSFQLTLVLHAFKFPAAKKITYSTCSVHAEENEQVVLKALQSDVARRRGWRILKQEQQVVGMREWPVRGSLEAAGGNKNIAEACIRSYKDDGRGVMGFFVAAFQRDGEQLDAVDESPSAQKEDVTGTPTTTKRGLPAGRDGTQEQSGAEPSGGDSDNDWDGFDD